MPLPRVLLSVDLPMWPVTIVIWNCHSWTLDASTRGVDLSVNLPIWPVTIAIWNCHSWPLDASTWGGGRSASWSAYMTCNNSNLKLPFLATRCLCLWRGRSASWCAYMTCNNSNLKLPLLATRCQYEPLLWNCQCWVDLPVDLPIWPVTIAIWNCHSWPLDASTWSGGTSASWSAYVTCNNSNLKLPFLATRYRYWWGDVPVNLPIWPVTIAIWNCHSWPLDASTWRGVDLPVDLPIWPVTIAIWNCHSWPLDASIRGVDLPVDLPIWPVTIAIWNCHYWPLDASTFGGVDLPVDLPMWPVTIAIWNCHSWPLDASTGGGRSVQLICLYDL